MTTRFLKQGGIAALMFLALLVTARPAHAQTLAPEQRMCDPTFEDCRADILTYINQETTEIDIGYWMMTDARYSNALVAAWQRGVKIRVLNDPRCVQEHPACAQQDQQLAGAGIPMRNRATSGILHWKVIIFAAQQQVEFAGANYAPYEMAPYQPWVNFTDEIVCFTNDPAIVHSFMTKYDDLWTSTTEFKDYANMTPALMTRSYPTYSIDPGLNFPPDDSYRTRSENAYAAEQQAIDVFMFRITDESQSNAIISAHNRGIPVRLITDETEYRNPDRLWDAYNVDKMYAAGVQVRLDAHQGINHAKGVILHGQGLSIFGSSNWTSPSSDSQREHNYFTTNSTIFNWLVNLFNRKWNNSAGYSETQPFVPLPPDVPAYHFPANQATGVDTTVALSWDAGEWAHLYDIYFGTTSNPPLFQSNVRLGPSQYTGDYRTFTLPFQLQPGTTYYWKIVSKTMAMVTADGPVWSFTTAGTAPPPNNPPSVTITSPTQGSTFAAPANITVSASASDTDGSIAKVDFYAGNTLIGTATSAPYSVTWSNVPTGSYTLTAVAFDNSAAATTSNAVSITVGSPTNGLPSGWGNLDVGATGAQGSSQYSNGTFTVTGAGADVWGTADAFQYAFRQMTGDGSIVARVATVGNTASWFKAGVMIRNSLSASAAHGYMLVSYAKGTAFQRRLSDGATSLSTTGSSATAPRWVKLTRSWNVITAYESADGSTWTTVGSDTFTMGSTVYVGLAVSSHVSGTTGTATFDHVTVTASGNMPPTVAITSPTDGAAYGAPANITITASASDSDGTVSKVDFYSESALIGTATASPYTVSWNNVPAGNYSLTAIATDNGGATTTSGAVSVSVGSGTSLPSGWTNSDVGSTGAQGSSQYANGTFSVTGAGADVWGTADAFQYAYTQMSGDGSIVARVATVANTASWFKAGVMIRNSLSPSAAHAFMLASYAKGMAFQRRVVDGGTSTNTAGSTSTAPRWVKLTRAGNLITAYESADGTTWTTVGSDSFTMGTTVYVGLAVSSHVTGVTGTATFDNVSVTTSGNSAPTVAMNSPADGATYTAPATVSLAASASDADGTIARVDFYAGSSLLGSVTSSTYALTWSNVPAGTYSLTAVATDNGGASTTSSAVTIAVNAAGDSPPTVAMTSPSPGATYTAPATVTLTADASDSDGTIASVSFYSGTTLLATVTSAPYTFDWTNVPAGTYSLTAVATDNGGASTTSSAASITVNDSSSSGSLPSGWQDGDVGAVPIAGSASFANNVFSLTGSGADIWGTADAFHYAYTQVTGDTTIVARVASVQDVTAWVKAGLMIRDTLDPASAHAFVLVSAEKGVAFQRRVTAGATSTNTTGTLSAAPHWVKLTRSGDTFTAYESSDGATWTLVGSDTISMGQTVYVGLAVTSHTTSSSATCTFDNVSIQ